MAPKEPITLSPHYVAPAQFDDPAAALAQVTAIYDGSVGHLRSLYAGHDLLHRRQLARIRAVVSS